MSSSDPDIPFSNTYTHLGEAFYQSAPPAQAQQPSLLLWNDTLAEQLLLSDELRNNSDLQADYFSGSLLPEGAEPVALAYCGHQFGHLNPQLGDGRAHLLGEVLNKDGQRVDIQLKGSGRTAFSRQGDGRCALGPALREFIMSEAMFYLGVPTTRCLAVVATGEEVYREDVKPGAVVTRIAASHIRVGTFQYFAIRDDIESLNNLLDYAIERHYPQIAGSENEALAFLEAVMQKQIELVVAWMRVGFIHGVMNTDNSAISGETIDFGPCAMLGAYDPGTVYSSIDHGGRYAFGNQPTIALWNITRLAECLLPLIDKDEKQAVEKAKGVLEQFHSDFESNYFTMFANKLGFEQPQDKDIECIVELMELMKNQQMDYTQAFVALSDSLKNNIESNTSALQENSKSKEIVNKLGDWHSTWRQLLEEKHIEPSSAVDLMQKSNPVVIPRNHHVEAVLKDCEESGSTQAIKDFLLVLRSPYQSLPTTHLYQDSPDDGDKYYQTFCGT